MLSPRKITLLVGLLRDRILDLRAVYLFGSRAGADQDISPDSDWDLAFLADGARGLDAAERFYLAQDISSALDIGYVDLIDLCTAESHLLRMNVIDGRRLWTRDSDEAMAWEAK